MPENPKKRGRPQVAHSEAQDAIEAALNQIGAEPNEAGWTQLAPLVGLSPRSLVNVYGGSSNLGSAAYAMLRAIAAGSSHQPMPNQTVASSPRVGEQPGALGGSGRALRWVPVVSWAHMGQAVCYEELPMTWQERIPTDCPDERAFAVTLVGDCMEPRYYAGELAIAMPSMDLRPGCLVLAKLANDGVIFRRYHEVDADTVRLTAYNPVFPEMVLPREAFHWIYPVYGTFKRDWR